jgi:hypothetical protein
MVTLSAYHYPESITAKGEDSINSQGVPDKGWIEDSRSDRLEFLALPCALVGIIGKLER